MSQQVGRVSTCAAFLSLTFALLFNCGPTSPQMARSAAAGSGESAVCGLGVESHCLLGLPCSSTTIATMFQCEEDPCLGVIRIRTVPNGDEIFISNLGEAEQISAGGSNAGCTLVSVESQLIDENRDPPTELSAQRFPPSTLLYGATHHLGRTAACADPTKSARCIRRIVQLLKPFFRNIDDALEAEEILRRNSDELADLLQDSRPLRVRVRRDVNSVADLDETISAIAGMTKSHPNIGMWLRLSDDDLRIALEMFYNQVNGSGSYVGNLVPIECLAKQKPEVAKTLAEALQQMLHTLEELRVGSIRAAERERAARNLETGWSLLRKHWPRACQDLDVGFGSEKLRTVLNRFDDLWEEVTKSVDEAREILDEMLNATKNPKYAQLPLRAQGQVNARIWPIWEKLVEVPQQDRHTAAALILDYAEALLDQKLAARDLSTCRRLARLDGNALPANAPALVRNKELLKKVNEIRAKLRFYGL